MLTYTNGSRALSAPTRAARLAFPLYDLCLSYAREPNSSTVPKVGVLGPLNKLELSYERWLEPPALLHLRRRQARTPTAGLLLGLCKGTFDDFERLEPFEQLSARCQRLHFTVKGELCRNT